MGPGATVDVVGRGVPRLACLRSRAWLHQRLGTAHLHQPTLKTLVRQTTQGLLENGLTRQAREEVERSRQGVPREVLVTQAMTIKARRAPGWRQPMQCPHFSFGAKGASASAEYRGIRHRFPYRCNKTKTSGTAERRSSWSPSQRHRQGLLAGEDQL